MNTFCHDDNTMFRVLNLRAFPIKIILEGWNTTFLDSHLKSNLSPPKESGSLRTTPPTKNYKSAFIPLI